LRPFKKFFCDRKDTFGLAANAFKIWMYHYCLEGEDRKSWPSRETICKDLKINIDTLTDSRLWLLKNGWLEKVGERNAEGRYAVPIFRVKRGIIPTVEEKTRDGKKQSRSRRKNSVAPDGKIPIGSISSEVYPKREVEETVKPAKQIPILSLQILGVKAEKYENLWAEVRELTEAFGPEAVIDAFEAWAGSQDPDSVTKPVAAFLSVAPGILRGIRTGGSNPAAKRLVLDLSSMSKGRVTFSVKQSSEIARLLSTYTELEIKAAFSDFLQNLDDAGVRFAGKDFSEKAEQIIYSNKKIRQELQNIEVIGQELANEQSLEVSKEVQAALKREAEEIDELPTA